MRATIRHHQDQANLVFIKDKDRSKSLPRWSPLWLGNQPRGALKGGGSGADPGILEEGGGGGVRVLEKAGP